MPTMYVNPKTGTIDEVAGGFIVHVPDFGGDDTTEMNAEELVYYAQQRGFQVDNL